MLVNLFTGSLKTGLFADSTPDYSIVPTSTAIPETVYIKNYLKENNPERPILDMHLKNFSLIKKPEIGWSMSPAYDLVPTALVVEGDTEEMALNLNGKKRKIKISDFKSAMHRCHIPEKAMENIFKKFEDAESKWGEIIQNSFLPGKLKASFSKLIKVRVEQLY